MMMAPMDYALARLPLFRSFPKEALASLDQVFLLRSYARKEPIFEEGGAADAVYLLRSGLVKAVKYSPQGEPVIMQIIAPGHLFGMMGVMEQKSYPVSTVCINDSEAYRIRAVDFADLLKRHPEWSKAVFAEMGSHLRTGQALRTLAKEPVEKRIAYILWLLSQTMGQELNIRREDVAEMAFSTTETAIRVLGNLRKNKFISSRWKRITILKPDALRKISSAD